MNILLGHFMIVLSVCFVTFSIKFLLLVSFSALLILMICLMNLLSLTLFPLHVSPLVTIILMSRKKPNVNLPFFGVHRAEWFRIADDFPELVGDFHQVLPCRCCPIHDDVSNDTLEDCSSSRELVCERCVLSRVQSLINRRFTVIVRQEQFENNYPRLFDVSDNLD